jgi:aspartyl-tRNA(Asn)/glutamyl-tRNA(Gln) amidotransferase subunit A
MANRGAELDLAAAGALDLIAAYRSRTVSPVEVVDALEAQIESTEPLLNAWAAPAFEQARKAAAEAERAWRSGEARPLEGVPFGVKDLFDSAGVRTAYGSPMFDSHVPERDARAVERAKEAGAVLLGKTATDEFAYGIAGVNPHYGAARNAWDPERVSGGSSSGSGVALAARHVPLALGSDTGGSIRSPSSFNGVVGLKGTWGAISTDGMWPMGRSLDHAGPMARTPADVALLHAVLGEGSRGRPIAQALEGQLRPAPPATRVGLCPDLDPYRPAPDVRRVFEECVKVLQGCGFQFRELPSPEAASILATFVPIRDAETLYTHRRAGLFPGRRSEYSERTYSLLEPALAVGLDEYLVASARRWRLAETFAALFESVDVVLHPLTSRPPPRIDDPEPDQAVWDSLGMYMVPENLLGLPACAVRAGFDDLGLPVGVQLVGRAGADATVLSVAQTLWEATPSIQNRWPDTAAAQTS